ncbi:MULTISPECIES: A24 family peptidase [unclassified Isoptericola]|uniref:prepilin peptidase n=1 Tax=unclassified Isoptericola TaxID=2623355 RepID=UPI00271244EE|nr:MULTISPECIES: A24 family peptidase [unclassified Isoptericola]MDO8147084.1 A24 family peptidase [Isoptericola sp. b515]MDO8150601.1 A24 family peptidase [Isoptericola sp. b408]
MPTMMQRTRSEVAPVRRTVVSGALPVIAWAVWVSGPGWATPAVAVAAVAGLALFAVDVRTHRLPDALTYPTTALVTGLLAVAGAVTGAWAVVARGLLGAAVLGGGYLVLHLLHRSGLGLGDVKLAVPLGLVTAWFGWPVLAATAVLPFLLGGTAALVLLATRRATRSTAIAFGPFMLGGAAVALTAHRLLAG